MEVAFISDIHANLEALEAVLKRIDSLGIKRIYCVGDVVGYGPNPNECLDIIKKRKIPCTIGNHEFAVINQETSRFNIYATEAIWWTIDYITKDNLEFIRTFSEKIEVTLDGVKILVVHGSPIDPINEYVFPDYPLERIVKVMNEDVLVLAHTHIPFIKRVRDKLIINSGSVGQPRDRDPRGCFILLNTNNLNAKIIRVEYDIKKTAKKIIKAGLPDFLAQRLFSGI